MGIFPEIDEDAIFLSRSDITEDLGTFLKHSFELDRALWPSVERYFQTMKFEGAGYHEKIRTAAHPKKARKLGRNRLKKVRKDWAKVKTIVMTKYKKNKRGVGRKIPSTIPLFYVRRASVRH